MIYDKIINDKIPSFNPFIISSLSQHLKEEHAYSKDEIPSFNHPFVYNLINAFESNIQSKEKAIESIKQNKQSIVKSYINSVQNLSVCTNLHKPLS